MEKSRITAEYYRVLNEVAHSRMQAAGDITEYQLEAATFPAYNQTGLLILSGISGSGKTIIGAELEKHGYKKIRNTYTRPQRPNETAEDGIFIDEPTFREWESQGKFLTTSTTNGSLHGLLKSEVEQAQGAGRFYADKSVGSARKLLNYIDRYCLVYVLPPSFEELLDRINAREQIHKTLTEQQIFGRFEEEIGDMRRSADLPYVYIVNDSISRVIQKLTTIGE